MNGPDVEAVRGRALELADRGEFNHWEDIAVALQNEGFATAMDVLEQDASLRMRLNARCAQAKRK